MNNVERWFIVLRAYSWPASVVPIGVASAYSYKNGWFILHDFLIILLAGFLIHLSGNLINTYYDFINGVDSQDADDIGIVKGLVEPSMVIKLGWLFLFAGSLLGFYIVFRYSLWWFLIIAFIGVALTVAYTANPFSLKYKALGEVVIFLCFGPLLVAGSVMIFAKKFIPQSILYSLPTVFPIVNLLLSNNIRDYLSDKQSGIKTIVDVIGIKVSKLIYIFFHLMAYISVLVVHGFSYGILAFFICIPFSIKIFTLLKQSSYQQLTRESAKFILIFGIVFISVILWG